MNPLVEAIVRTDAPSSAVQPDFEVLADVLRQIRDRFIEERTKGWVHPETGRQMPPVSREEAEQRWKAVEPRFREVIIKGRNDPETNRRLRTGDKPGRLPRSSDYFDTDRFQKASHWMFSQGGPEGADVVPKANFNPPPMNPEEYERGWNETPGQRAAREEPSLRRGESKARQILNQLLA